ncbi:MAG: hypothetical protein FJZ90_05140 [Chloroflexi bacterium]|nr:hypothetical protein [Chloroflexota bacterium]
MSTVKRRVTKLERRQLPQNDTVIVALKGKDGVLRVDGEPVSEAELAVAGLVVVISRRPEVEVTESDKK